MMNDECQSSIINHQSSFDFMIVIPRIPFLSHGSHKQAAGPTPPTTSNRILRVVRGEGGDRFIVTLSAPLTGYEDVDWMFEVTSDGSGWDSPYTLDNADPSNVVFLFAVEVGSAIQWRVEAPENWHFADGEPLVDPFSGTIEENDE